MTENSTQETDCVASGKLQPTGIIRQDDVTGQEGSRYFVQYEDTRAQFRADVEHCLE